MSFRQRHLFPHNLFYLTFCWPKLSFSWMHLQFGVFLKFYFLNAAIPRLNQFYTALRHLSIMLLGWSLLQTPIMFFGIFVSIIGLYH